MDEKLVSELQNSYQMSQEIEEQYKIVNQQLDELKEFFECLNGLENKEDDEILASLGKGVYVKAKVKGEKFFVDTGAGVFVRKNNKETKNLVESQMKKLSEMKSGLMIEGENIQNKLRELMKNFEKAK